MKKFVIAAAAALALGMVPIAASAQSHNHGSSGGGGGGGWHGASGWHGGGGWHGGPRFGLSLGFPAFYYWGPGYYPYAYAYPYPYTYYDGGSYDDGAPQTYIQRDTGDAVAPAAPPQASRYSYYCTNPAGYYPQVGSCPSGWMTVVPNGSPRAAPAPR
jgi:opacity protein-like surface antigen